MRCRRNFPSCELCEKFFMKGATIHNCGGLHARVYTCRVYPKFGQDYALTPLGLAFHYTRSKTDNFRESRTNARRSFLTREFLKRPNVIPVRKVEVETFGGKRSYGAGKL